MPGPRTKLASDIAVELTVMRRKADEAWLGITAQFTNGRYKGRWGIVRAVQIDDRQGVLLLVQPYRMEVVGEDGFPNRAVDDGELLYQHPDARSYRPVDQYEFKDDYEACRMCGRRVASPCHDAESFHQNGPWDNFCRDIFNGRT